MQCSKCTANQVDFEETEFCSPRQGAQVLPKVDALKWLRAVRTGFETDLQRFLQSRPIGFERACAAALDGWFVVKNGPQTAVNPIAWGAAHILHSHYAPRNEHVEELTPEETTNIALNVCREIAILNELEHLIEQETRSLVIIPKKKVEIDDSIFQPVSRLIPTVAAWNHRGKTWTRWTQIGLHSGPDSLRAEPEFAKALADDNERASVLAKMMTLGIPIALINSLREFQDVKRYAEDVPTSLVRFATLDRRAADDIRNLLDELIGEAGIAPHRSHVTGSSATYIMPSSAPQLRQETATRLTFGNPLSVAPLFLSEGTSFRFSPEMAQGLLRLAFLQGQVEGGERMTKVAGYHFEVFISELLKRLGYTTEVDGTRLVGCSATKDSEVDVVAWNSKRVLLIEAKSEMENPGAWAESSQRDRVKQVQEWRDDLAKKAEKWKAAFASKKPVIYDSSRSPVKLQRGQFATHQLTLAIVSIRVETRPAEGPVAVYTYMPPMAAAVALRRLAPVDRFAPIWDGENDFP